MISEETLKYIEEHPSGKMDDLPQEMKDFFNNTVKEFQNQKGENQHE
jgi:hypothetical protein